MPFDPTSSKATPLLRRPGCWVFFLTVIPLLIGGLFVGYNFFGDRHRARIKAEIAATGLELDPHKIPSARPPDAENFFATPLLSGIGAGAARGPGMDAASRIRKWDEIAYDAKARIEPVHGANPTDWAAVRDAIAATDTQAGLTPTDDPLADLLASLDRDLAPLLTELTAALARPKSHLVPDFYDGLRAGEDPNLDKDPWIKDVRNLAWALVLQARLEIEAGKPRSVSDTVPVLLRLAEGVENEGSSLGVLIANSVSHQAASTAWTAADRRLLPREAWLAWASAFSRPRPPDLLPDVVRGEMIHLQYWARHLRADPSRLYVNYALGGGLDPPERWRASALRLIPQGWFDHNEANALQVLGELRLYFKHPDQPHSFSRESVMSWILSKVEPDGVLRHNAMARSSLGHFPTLASHGASNHAVSRLAQAACALEAYFLDHQAYPASLDALVPGFLPAVPVDFDGQPIRYALNPANGRYKLWSIGEDGVDDGGMEKMEHPQPNKSPRPWVEPIGDWVWEYAR